MPWGRVNVGFFLLGTRAMVRKDFADTESGKHMRFQFNFNLRFILSGSLEALLWVH